MLSTDNADMVRRDPGIPGLATLLDPEAFVIALRLFLPDTDLGTAQLTYIRYKPTMNCLVTYRFEAAGTTLDIYAKAHGPDERIKLQKARERQSIAGPFDSGRILLEDIGVVVSVFPNDIKLKALGLLGEAQALRKLLCKLLPDRPDLWDGAVQTLGYKPERRYVGKLQTANGSCAVLKFYTQAGYQTAYTNAGAFVSRGPLRLALGVSRSKRHRIMVFEWLPGHSLQEAISDPNLKFETLAAVGAALAEFHAQEPKGLTYRTRDAEATTLFSLADMLGFLCPRLARRAERLAGELAAWLEDEPPVHRPLHGDFYAKQVMIADGQIGIIDFDEAVLGDPRADIGLFIAHLERDMMRSELPASRVAPLTDALLEGYQQVIGKPLPADLQMYAAVGLFQLAHHPFRYCEPDWAARTEAILEHAEAFLKRVTRKALSKPYIRTPRRTKEGCEELSVTIVDPYRVADYPEKMPFLSRALNPLEIQNHFRRCLSHLTGRKGQICPLAIRVTRHKSRRRCLIEYDLRIERPGSPPEMFTIVGKSRAKGLDKSSYHLLKSLRKAGFGADSEDGIFVPEPIGAIPEFQMWLQYKVPGTVATHLLAEPGGVLLARQIAEAAHKLHTAGIPARRRHTTADELRILHERLPLVAKIKPQWARRLDRVLDACDRLGATIPEPRLRGIHRDFYADHVIVDGSNLYLVDFDLYCEGDSALDIGNFLGHLTEQSLRTLGDPEAMADQEEALEERFVELSGKGTRAAVRAYTTLTLVRHIYLSTQFPKRRPFTEALLALCEQRLSAQGGQYEQHPVSHFGA